MFAVRDDGGRVIIDHATRGEWLGRMWIYRVGRQLIGYALALSLTSALTAVAVVVTRHTEVPNISLLFIPVILVTAVSFGTGPSLLAATLAVVEYDFFLLEPRYTFTITRTQDVLAFAVFVIVALLTSQLAVRARARAEEASRRARDSAALQKLGQALMVEQALPDVLQAITRHVVETLGIRRCAILTPDATGQLALAAATPQGAALERQSFGVAAWVYRQEEERSLRMTGARCLYVPLRTADHVVGVMELVPKRSGEALDPHAHRLVTSLAAQTALVIMRARGDEERQRREVLEESDRLKSALLSAVSHDLRTPLASIKTAATSLILPGDHLGSEAGQELLQTINHEADRLNRLVGNLLDLSRIEAGVLHPALDWYAVSEMLDTVLPRIRPLLASRQLSIDVEPGLPAIHIDLLRVEELLMNLVENVAKYSPPRTSVELVVHRESDGMRIAVVDHGAGVSVQQRDRVFRSFQRGCEHSDRHPGTGLGLAICRGIAEAHGGTITICDTPGGGATFVFTLPASHIEQGVVG